MPDIQIGKNFTFKFKLVDVDSAKCRFHVWNGISYAPITELNLFPFHQEIDLIKDGDRFYYEASSDDLAKLPQDLRYRVDVSSAVGERADIATGRGIHFEFIERPLNRNDLAISQGIRV